MMIKVYPVKIEAVDEDGDVAFTMETLDAHAATVEVKTIVRPENIDELTSAMRRAVVMLEMENSEQLQRMSPMSKRPLRKIEGME